jgi:type IX secretion system PorP/SprF family membrane protein
MKRGVVHIMLILAMSLTGGPLMAQQLPIYSQYVLNGFMVNPAMAGYDGYTTFNTTARQQWLGFSQAPRTYSAAWQTRVMSRSYRIINSFVKNENKLKPSTKGRVGLGAYLVNDVNANVARTGASFTYAYHIYMNNRQLSFGLAGKVFQYRINSDRLTFGVDGDPVLNGDFRTVTYSPDADFGVLFQDPNYFIGLSVSNLLQTAFKMWGNETVDFWTSRHYWIMGAYRFTLSDMIDMEPGVLLKTTEDWNPQGDFTVKLYFDNQFWGGLSYRTDQSVILLLGVRVDGLFFGYSFDWGFSEIGHFNYGSHEIILAVKLGDVTRRYKWLNRY